MPSLPALGSPLGIRIGGHDLSADPVESEVPRIWCASVCLSQVTVTCYGVAGVTRVPLPLLQGLWPLRSVHFRVLCRRGVRTCPPLFGSHLGPQGSWVMVFGLPS